MGTAVTVRKSPPSCRAQLVLQPLGPLCLCPAEQPNLKDKVAAALQGGFVYSSVHLHLKTGWLQGWQQHTARAEVPLTVGKPSSQRQT